MALKELRGLLDEMGAVPDERAPAPKRKVLVVDDDPGVRASLQFLLQDLYDVVVASDAATGVEAMSDDIVTVVLDIKMQGKDGFWVCEQIQRSHPQVPVIFHSAYQDVKDPYEIINAHRPFAYVTKGESPTKLLNAVERATKLYTQIAESRSLVQRLRGEAHAKAAAKAVAKSETAQVPAKDPFSSGSKPR
jgi:DNA-binding NtrC family response regulator